MTTVYKIKGMNCAHCRAAAEKAISEVEGVESVRVDLAAGTAEVTGDVPAEKIINAVHLAGFEASIL